MEKKKISLIGCGKLGICFGLLVAEAGYDVLACDISAHRVSLINNKALKTSEPHVEEMLKTSTIKATTNIKECFNHSDLLFVLVATPSLPSGEYDHSQINNIVEQLEQYQIKDKTLIINATTMPKYCESIKERLKPLNINVLYSPEFIAQGSVIQDYRRADIILIGGEDIPVEIFDLYGAIMDVSPVFKILSLTGAELAKISINCFLTLKTAYANLIGEVCIESGEEENISNILETIGSDSRIGNKYLKYGFPASGVCLPRDVRALRNYISTTKLSDSLLEGMVNENEEHLYFMVDYYLKKNPNKEIPFIFSHITYKKGVDILTESKQLELCLELLREGYIVLLPTDSLKLSLPQELLEFKDKGQVKFLEVGYGYQVN